MKLKINISFALVFVIFFITVMSTIVCADTPKHILLIVMDGARYDYCTPETMPNLYSFMERALVFKNAYAPSSWTLPSHASLFTGLYPQQHGAFRLPYQPTDDVAVDSKRRLEAPIDIDAIALPRDAMTIAEILHAAGYQTLSVFGNPCYGYPIFNLPKGFDTWVNLVEEKLKATGIKQRGFYSFDYEVDGNFYTVIPNASEVAREVTTLLETADPARPIFLFINFEDPIATPFYYHPQKRAEVFNNYSQYLKKSMKSIDDVIVPVLSMFKDGLIIVTSDHGQGDGTAYKGAVHGTSLYSSQTKIPLFIYNYMRKKLNPEAPIDLTRIMDIILNAAGLDYPGKKQFFHPGDNLAFSHLDASPESPVGTQASFSIISEQALLLLTFRSGGFTKHYITQKAMGENIDERFGIEQVLSRKIMPFVRLERVFPTTGKYQKLDENNLEMLKGLGYIE